MQSTLRLFKALPISDKNAVVVDHHLHKQTIPMGFIFSAEVIGNYPNARDLIALVDGLYGRDPEKLNKSFHKSFAKVRDASLEELAAEQMAHYLSTYGAERLGVFDVDYVYIPSEQLNVPGVTDELRLVVIRGLTHAELKDKLLSLLQRGVALSEQSVQDVLEVAALVGLNTDEVATVKNREVKVALYKHLGLVPSDPSEFLRFVIHEVTGETLLIKNRELINKIKVGIETHNPLPLFLRYERENGSERLGEVFLRHKPLFLAFRQNAKMRPIINRIRRAAKRVHKPLPQDYLNDVTALIARGELNEKRLKLELEKVNIFRKIRLAHALRVRTNQQHDSILYRIRNGKSFAKEFHFAKAGDAAGAYNVVVDSIIGDLQPKLNGKKIFIPAGLVYGLPATEKQFTGNLPMGTFVDVVGDIVCGVYWEDQGGHRIDLDLSMVNASGKIGWDSNVRDRNNQIYFSGDNTSAPKGASEVFHIGQNAQGVWMMNVNYFNYRHDVPVPFKIVVGSEEQKNINQSYVLDANHLIAATDAVMDEHQKNLGIVVADGNVRRFYFSESTMGGGASARHNAHSEQARKFLYRSLTDAPTLNEILERVGVTFVGHPDEADIDLSPEVVDKTTLIELLSGD